jgi:hypothetical protein
VAFRPPGQVYRLNGLAFTGGVQGKRWQSVNFNPLRGITNRQRRNNFYNGATVQDIGHIGSRGHIADPER